MTFIFKYTNERCYNPGGHPNFICFHYVLNIFVLERRTMGTARQVSHRGVTEDSSLLRCYILWAVS